MRRAFVTLMLASALVVLGTAIPATSALASKPKVKKVAFSGTPSEPTVTVTGLGMGSIPIAEDEPAPECLEAGTPTGENFGTSLLFSDESRAWTAGQDGDCIGLVVKTFTETEIVFQFGSNYSQYEPVAKKDLYKFTVNGLTKTGKISIKKPPKP